MWKSKVKRKWSSYLCPISLKWLLGFSKGMTGSIVSPGTPMGWGHEGRIDKQEETFPTKYAYLLLETDDYRACFSDPRKFGKTELRTDLTPLEELAPDALEGHPEPIIDNIVQKSLGIKTLLLDQKKACAGVGNWVADEVLYQCGLHPDQSFLSLTEASTLVNAMQSILREAVKCLSDHVPYPADWLFPYRWTKKKAGKDGQGRSITFLKSGGRTSAIIAAKQRLYKRKRSAPSDEDEGNVPEKVVKRRQRRR
jgi:formamidopyrimidine-DNA glycosylase